MIIISQNLLILILSLLQYYTSLAAKTADCSPSACGMIRNISSPFRLKNECSEGDGRLELACENNMTFISLNSHKYYVKEINYLNQTIRVADASINDGDICSFPIHSFHRRLDYPYPYSPAQAHPIHFISCPHPLHNSSFFTDITTNCSNSTFAYVKPRTMTASQIPHMCQVELIVMTSWIYNDSSNASLSEIHHSLIYGFDLNFCGHCREPTWQRFRSQLLSYLVLLMFILGAGLIPGIAGLLIIAPKVIICPLVVWFLIYKFRRRHLSTYEAIESFLRSDNNLAPIRYSYSHIKKITQNFQDKLGQGGYGSVYKGKLRSGHDVAVKLLTKSGGNGQDFMNEIATIGRIHHVNVVKLVGYCAHGSKRALVFDFMPNGSLEKYLFNREKMNSLTWDTKFEIAVGVALGIEYLHRGCDVQILHFDIKPHNILLDDSFIPKISDFGLAKYCSTDKKTMTMTAARGTIGYVAPELISPSIGAVSYKADVYSFGMLLVEMVGLRRDLRGNNSDSSKYFPYWIYDCFNQGEDIEIGNADENDGTGNLICRKMTIVALWCIQMNPDDRPSMNKVLEMLEVDVERLQIPNYPPQSTDNVVDVDESGATCSTESSSTLLQLKDESQHI